MASSDEITKPDERRLAARIPADALPNQQSDIDLLEREVEVRTWQQTGGL